VIQVGPSHGTHVSPRSTGGACTQSVNVFVEDVDALYARVRAAGARVSADLTDKHYGDRSFGALDCEGHAWWFAQRIDESRWQESTREHRTPGAA
jgi:uncharacterized glyoxalase superfamily protein PhnB